MTDDDYDDYDDNPAFEEWWKTASWGDRMMYRLESSARLEQWAVNADAWMQRHPRFAAWLDRVTRKIQ